MKRIKIDVSEVQRGDTFVEAPELGSVLYNNEVDVSYGRGATPGVGRKIWTTKEKPDVWAAPQEVEVDRPE